MNFGLLGPGCLLQPFFTLHYPFDGPITPVAIWVSFFIYLFIAGRSQESSFYCAMFMKLIVGVPTATSLLLLVGGTHFLHAKNESDLTILNLHSGTSAHMKLVKVVTTYKTDVELNPKWAQQHGRCLGFWWAGAPSGLARFLSRLILRSKGSHEHTH